MHTLHSLCNADSYILTTRLLVGSKPRPATDLLCNLMLHISYQNTSEQSFLYRLKVNYILYFFYNFFFFIYSNLNWYVYYIFWLLHLKTLEGFKNKMYFFEKNTYYNFKVITGDNHIPILDPLHSWSWLPSDFTFKYNVHGFVSIYVSRLFQESRWHFKI